MSNFFEWNAAKYSLEIPEMDADHRVIIDCMNRLHLQSEADAGRFELGRTFDQLIRVTEQHFGDEEVYMQQIDFPGASKHKLIHRQLLDRMHQFRREFHSSGALTREFFFFLSMWLKSHICGIDTKYAEHAQSKAA